jgi:hypothetical protein
MKKLTRDQIVCSGAFLTCAFVCTAYGYLLLSLDRMKGTVEELHAKQEVLTRSAQVQAVTRDQIAYIEPFQIELDSYIVQKDFPTPLLSELEHVERVLGVPILVRSIAHSTVQADSGASGISLDLTLSFSGNWDDVRKTLHTLEQLSFIAKVYQYVLEQGDTERRGEWSGTAFLKVMAR